MDEQKLLNHLQVQLGEAQRLLVEVRQQGGYKHQKKKLLMAGLLTDEVAVWIREMIQGFLEPIQYET